MPDYATQQDIVDRRGEDALYVAFDRDGDGVLDTDAIATALADATEEIDTYLARRYPLPLAEVPGVLVRLCVDIALYQGSVGTAQTEEKRQHYEDAVSLLNKLAAGTVSLGLPSESVSGASGAVFTGAGRLFNRDSLKGM